MSQADEVDVTVLMRVRHGLERRWSGGVWHMPERGGGMMPLSGHEPGFRAQPRRRKDDDSKAEPTRRKKRKKQLVVDGKVVAEGSDLAKLERCGRTMTDDGKAGSFKVVGE